jgi:uncharacterized coiled-coil protein SlyX
MNDDPAANSLQARLQRLEVLYSEQDYTIQALNNTVTQQDRELATITLRFEQLQQQLHSLRSEVAGDTDPGTEQPPHY